MNHHGRARHSRASSESGFTLVELLVAIVLLGIILGATTTAMMTVFKNSSSVSPRVNDTTDAQITSAFYTRDIQNATTINTSSTPLCGSGGVQVLGLSWSTDGIPTTVSYVNDNETLVRDVCSGSTTPTASVTVSHDLSASSPPTVSITCDATVASCQPDGSGLWPSGIATVTLNMNEPNSNFQYDLAAAPRVWTPVLANTSVGGVFVPPLLLLGAGSASCNSPALSVTGSGSITVNGVLAVQSAQPCSMKVTGSGSLTATKSIQTADPAVSITSPAGSTDLNAISAKDTSDIWAVGANCTVIFYNGTSWISLSSSITSATCSGQNLTGIDADGGKPVIVGNGVAFTCTQKCTGTSAAWTPNLATKSGFNGASLTAVGAASATSFWAVGTNCTVLYYNGGSTWTNETTTTTPCSATSGATLLGVVLVKGTSNPIVVGASATLSTCTANCTSANASWSADAITGLVGTPDLDGIATSASNGVWAVGGAGTIVECASACNSSGTWAVQDAGLADSVNLLGASGDAASQVLAVGDGSFVAQCASNCNALSVPTPWSSESFANSLQLNGVAYLSQSNGNDQVAWAVGQGGTILSIPFALVDTGSGKYFPAPNYAPPVSDPYANLAPPPMPGTRGGCSVAGSVDTCMPGYYTSSFSPICPGGSNSTVMLSSGVYYLENGASFSQSCGISSGPGGVLFYVEAGSISFTQSGSISFSPLQSGNIAYNMLVFQARDDCNALSVTASGAINALTGTMYLPGDKCTSGSSSATITGSQTLDLGALITQNISLSGSGTVTFGSTS